MPQETLTSQEAAVPPRSFILEFRGHHTKKGTGRLLARKRRILRETDFTLGPLHKGGGCAHEHPECEPDGMPRRRRRFQVSPT
jgi:hypothetical protein